MRANYQIKSPFRENLEMAALVLCIVLLGTLLFFGGSRDEAVRSVRRVNDSVYSIADGNSEQIWSSLVAKFTKDYTAAELTTRVFDDSSTFNDVYFDTSDNKLKDHGLELKFRSIINSDGKQGPKIVELIELPAGQSPNGEFQMTKVSYELVNSQMDTIPIDGDDIREALSSSGRSALISRLQAAQVVLEDLKIVMSVEQKRHRLKFKHEQQKVLSVSFDDSTALRGSAKSQDLRIYVQPEDTFAGPWLEFSNEVIAVLKEMIPSLKPSAESRMDRFRRELKM